MGSLETRRISGHTFDRCPECERWKSARARRCKRCAAKLRWARGDFEPFKELAKAALAVAYKTPGIHGWKKRKT
jgi:hypothetical protein